MRVNKYNNTKTSYKGIVFHSKKEAEYAQLLDTLKRAKSRSDKVHSFETQVSYPIIINGIKICTYIADFRVNYEDGREEIVDVKGFKTSIYKLKKKLVEASYNIKLKEV